MGGSLRGRNDAAPRLTGRVAVREGGRVRFGGRVYEIETGRSISSTPRPWLPRGR